MTEVESPETLVGSEMTDAAAPKDPLPAASLRTRTLRGMAWNFGNVGGGFVMQIVRGIVLARLLVPADFGLAGMAMGACALFGIFTNLGIGGALVQTPELQRRCSNSAFWLQCLATLCVALALCAAAPWVAAFYGDLRLAPIVCWLAGGMFLNGTITVPLALMQRELRFKEINVMWGVLRLISFALAILMAATGWSYWSLIVPDILTRLCALPILLWRQQWFPQLVLSISSLRPIMSFSIKSFLSTCLATINTNIDYVILGRFFAPEVFGLYFFGYQRVRGPLRLGTMSIRGALFPALSRVQKDSDAARRALFQGTPILAALLFPLATMGILAAPQFVPLVFGLEWAAATPLMQMFLVWTYFIPVNLLVTANFQARGIFAPTLLDGSGRAILMIVGLLFLGLSGHSIYWCGLWVVGVEIVGNALIGMWGMRTLDVTLKQVLWITRGPLLGSLVIIALDCLWWSMPGSSPALTAWAILIIRMFQACIVSMITIRVFDRQLVTDALSLVLQITPAPPEMRVVLGNASELPT